MPVMVMGTIDDLNATGNFPLIKGMELRRQISESVRELETVVAIDNQITQRIVPSINYVRSLVRFNLNTHITSPSEIDPKYVIYNFDKVCADQKFINAIGTVREMTLAAISFNQSLRNDQMVLVGNLKRTSANDIFLIITTINIIGYIFLF